MYINVNVDNGTAAKGNLRGYNKTMEDVKENGGWDEFEYVIYDNGEFTFKTDCAEAELLGTAMLDYNHNIAGLGLDEVTEDIVNILGLGKDLDKLKEYLRELYDNRAIAIINILTTDIRWPETARKVCSFTDNWQQFSKKDRVDFLRKVDAVGLYSLLSKEEKKRLFDEGDRSIPTFKNTLLPWEFAIDNISIVANAAFKLKDEGLDDFQTLHKISLKK